MTLISGSHRFFNNTVVSKSSSAVENAFDSLFAVVPCYGVFDGYIVSPLSLL
jgi:hypothetical protein